MKTMYQISLVFLVFVVAIFFRLSWLTGPAGPPETDEVEYEELASNLLSGKGFILEDGMAYRQMSSRNIDRPTGRPTAYRTPGFPLILAGIYRVAGHDHALARRALTVAIPSASLTETFPIPWAL
jgi:hypothetical protein